MWRLTRTSSSPDEDEGARDVAANEAFDGLGQVFDF